MSLSALSLTEAAEDIREGRITSAELVADCLARIDAVDAWLASRQWFHTMRDWPTHTDLLLAGMWGGVGGVLPPVGTLLGAYTAWRIENDHVDQDVLSEAVWPIARQSILIHDSVFAPCLGSVPFPPFGSLPPGHHVGENAFLRFVPNS